MYANVKRFTGEKREKKMHVNVVGTAAVAAVIANAACYFDAMPLVSLLCSAVKITSKSEMGCVHMCVCRSVHVLVHRPLMCEPIKQKS